MNKLTITAVILSTLLTGCGASGSVGVKVQETFERQTSTIDDEIQALKDDVYTEGLNEDTNARIKQLSDEIKILSESQEDLIKNNKDANDKIKNLESSIKTLEDLNLNDLNGKYSNLKSSIDSLQNKITDFETLKDLNDEEAVRITDVHIIQIRDDIKALQTKVNKIESSAVLFEDKNFEFINQVYQEIDPLSDDSASGSFDDSASGSFDDSASGSFDDSASGSFDDSASGSFDDSASSQENFQILNKALIPTSDRINELDEILVVPDEILVAPNEIVPDESLIAPNEIVPDKPLDGLGEPLDELDNSLDELSELLLAIDESSLVPDESLDELSESLDELDKSLDELDNSLDKLNELLIVADDSEEVTEEAEKNNP